MAKKILLGFSILILGILILLDNMNLLFFTLSIFKIWPIFVIIFAIGDMIDYKKINLTNLIVFAIGLYFLFYNFSIITISFIKIFLPIILIMIGLSLIFPKKIVKMVVKDTKNDLNITSIFSNIFNKCDSKEFNRANFTSIFGELSLDLENANILGNECVCICTIIFGNISIKIPDNWDINTDGLTCVFGGINNLKSKKSNKTVKNILYLTGTVIFGEIKIK